MQVEELLQMLRDAGMDDMAIADLLNQAVAALNPKEEPCEGEGCPQPENEDEKMRQVFGM